TGVTMIGRTRAQTDVTDRAAIDELLDTARPDAVINCAAYTAVDDAETDPEAAAALNTCAPQLLAEATAARGIALIHLSTDYVFEIGRASCRERVEISVGAEQCTKHRAKSQRR